MGRPRGCPRALDTSQLKSITSILIQSASLVLIFGYVICLPQLCRALRTWRHLVFIYTWATSTWTCALQKKDSPAWRSRFKEDDGDGDVSSWKTRHEQSAMLSRGEPARDWRTDRCVCGGERERDTARKGESVYATERGGGEYLTLSSFWMDLMTSFTQHNTSLSD